MLNARVGRRVSYMNRIGGGLDDAYEKNVYGDMSVNYHHI